MDGNILGTKLKLLRQRKKLTLQAVADYLDVNKSSVLRWEKGETAKISRSTLSSLSTLYGVTLDFLYCSNDSDTVPAASIQPYKSTLTIHELGEISAGLPKLADEIPGDCVTSDIADGDEYFALRVNGDSMNAARIENGDILIIRRQSYVENGEIAAVLVGDDEATVKKFYRDKDTVMLIPMSRNPIHNIQVYDLKETRIRILGKVIENKIRF